MICKLIGHEWEQVNHVPLHVDLKLDRTVGECVRCGSEATAREAIWMKANGSGPGSELLDQHPDDELKALYASGRIDKDELEQLAEENLNEQP